MTKESMTYSGVGVDYGSLDPFKLACQLAGAETAKNLLSFDQIEEYPPSRGESAYLIQMGKLFLAHVEEGLGTKNLVADAMYKLTGNPHYYDNLAQDTVAMIVNDMVTLGALPLSVAMHLAVGESNWFKDEIRSQHLINGWKWACDLAGCSWGCGETPTLKGIVVPGTFVLSGSAMGIIRPKQNIIRPQNIEDGDAIVIIESSGPHANGFTMARKIADDLPQGYLTTLQDGRTYGESLLDPTHIYVGLVKDCINAGVNIHYAVNITGHGWRKLMRAQGNFAYIIERLPTQLPIFDFLQKHGPIDDKEAYSNLNMGAGFALYVPRGDIEKVMIVAGRNGLQAFEAGHIDEDPEKKVVIKPKGNMTFIAEDLNIR